MTRPARILLADADAFFVAVARLLDPDGAGKAPLLIVGGSASGRGVVTSASYETRAYGVRSAMPTAQTLRLCPQAMVVPVPRQACVRKSREIRAALERFTPVVEAASIDEFYLDLSGTESLYREPLERTATRIREAVQTATGISVSIGGGTSRLIAKLAAQRAKPRAGVAGGVRIVPPGEEAAFVAQLDLAEIPMIGPRFQERLARYGLVTVRDALRHDPDTLAAWFGKRTGQWLYRRIRGQDGGGTVGGRRRHSMGHEETFPRDLERDEDLERELVRLTARLAADVRAAGLAARTVTLKLRDFDFRTRSASHTLRETLTADRPLIAVARALLHRLRRTRRCPARLLGVSVSVASGSEAVEQLGMFDDQAAATTETERDRTLARAMDTITGRFGRRGIARGAEVDRSGA